MFVIQQAQPSRATMRSHEPSNSPSNSPSLTSCEETQLDYLLVTGAEAVLLPYMGWGPQVGGAKSSVPVGVADVGSLIVWLVELSWC